MCCCAGVYTAYKPYLNKDEEIIKQLQKVGSSVLSGLAANCLDHISLLFQLSSSVLSAAKAESIMSTNSWNISSLVCFSFLRFPSLTHVRRRPVQIAA